MSEQKELTASMDAVPEELSVRPGAVSQVTQRVVVELSPEQKKFNAAMNMARTLARSQIVPSDILSTPFLRLSKSESHIRSTHPCHYKYPKEFFYNCLSICRCFYCSSSFADSFISSSIFHCLMLIGVILSEYPL